MRLSFIIPIYNTPKEKIERCFNSILLLETSDYECIIVDDGSMVYVKELCLMYADRYKQFKYYYQSNQGVSSARNYGIKQAQGDYIAFVDADDEICPEAVDQIILVESNADIIISDLEMVSEKSKESWKAFDNTKIDYYMVIERLFKDRTLNGPYCKYIKRQILNDKNIRFNVALFSGEDAYFFKELMLNNPSIEYISKVSYIYYKESVSLRKRIIKYKTLFFDNAAICYDMDIKCILYGDFTKDKKDILIQKCNEAYIVNLFLGGGSDPIIYKIFNEDYKKSLYNALERIEYLEINEMSTMTKFFYYVIKNRMWWLLRIYSKIRKIHLKRKGLM